MRCLAIIPARSGSKGLIDKNIKPLNGKPLLTYTINAAIQSNKFDEIMVSTDSEDYAEISKNAGAKVPFYRSGELSSDNASSWDVVYDVLSQYSKKGISFDTIALLQPTSPLRDSEDIKRAFDLMKEKDAQAIISVCEVDHSPLLSNVLSHDLSMNGFINEGLIQKRRQELPIHYRINGAIYIIKNNYLTERLSLYSEKSFAYVMDNGKSIDIDTDLDFKLAELILQSSRIK
ncbi:cytidylyltransferase domain-containing protein [Paraliobacillus sediminis]|uniref:acylneuraminate cytidylyltransferase family protein n=1 Tax=Paraliobacillus sediminis TaxID=1885916 RepID=UPI000E3DFAA3|nr:acylneuraminate cytidylyltransferase family protein [Paraliobacillus sediminis]